MTTMLSSSPHLCCVRPMPRAGAMALLGALATWPGVTGCYVAGDLDTATKVAGKDAENERDASAADPDAPWFAAAWDAGTWAPVDAAREDERTNGERPVDARAEDAGSLVQHPACRMPLPSELPPPPQLPVDALGVNRYNAWQAAGCEGVPELIPCDADTPCPFYGQCLFLSADGPGICAEDRGGCSGEGAPLGYRDGQCLSCVPEEVKRALCCAGLSGVDCRAFPFEGSSRPGELCAEHSDCETGLVCQGSLSSGHGRCLCPGVSFASLRAGASCAIYTEPASWGGGGTRFMEPGSCRPAEAEGYSVHSLALSASPSQLSATTDDQGDPQLLISLSNGDVVHAGWHARRWSMNTLPGVHGESVALARDAQGQLHGLVGAGLQYLRREADGTWSNHAIQTVIPWGGGFGSAAGLVFTDAGTPVAIAGANTSLFALYSGPDPMAQAPWKDVPLPVTDTSYLWGLAARMGAQGQLHVLAVTARYLQHVFGDQEGFATENLGQAYEAQFVESAGRLEWMRGDSTGDSAGSVSLGSFEAGNAGERPLWSVDDPRYRARSTAPSGARDATGKLWVAHLSPHGLALLEQTEQESRDTVLDPSYEGGTLLLDGAGEPHVLYMVWSRSPWDYNTSVRELRHLFRGSCPPDAGS